MIWSTVGPCNTSLSVASDCLEARGGGFDSQRSSTWQDEGQYDLGLNNLLGYSGGADYGFDTVGLGYNNASGPTLPHQIVAEIKSDSFWFGLLGMGFQPTNFTGYANPQASFADTLASNGTIASRSWSYTAGAYYRLKSVFGSLIFGGYDAARFTPNNVVFTMTGDNLRDIVLYVRGIASTASSGNTTLMSTPEKVFIDSTVVDFWLPVDVCQKFESTFGLTYNSNLNRYFVNESSHSTLLSQNPNVTFTLADQQSGGHTVDLVLPYAAFDLNLSAPLINSSTPQRYFPLRQGQNDSMYTLGRAFLQEAYVTADYETRTFNVSQCVFDVNAQSQILAIPRDMPVPVSGGAAGPSGNGTGGGTGTGGSGGGGGGGGGSSGTGGALSAGAIAGIVIGSVLLLLLLLLFCCCCVPVGPFARFNYHRRRAARAAAAGEKPSGSGSGSPVYEIDSGKRIDPNASAYSAQASGLASEVPGQDAKVEIAGRPIMHPQELEAEVPASFVPVGHPAVVAPAGGIGRGTGSGHSGSNADSSDGTRTSQQVSSLEPSPESAAAKLLKRSPQGSGSGTDSENVISPQSPTAPGGQGGFASWNERRRERRMNANGSRDEGGVPGISVSSPTDTEVSGWTPDTDSPVMARGRGF